MIWVFLDLNNCNDKLRDDIVNSLTTDEAKKKYSVKAFESKYHTDGKIRAINCRLPLAKAFSLLTRYNGKLKSSLQIKL